MIACVHCLLELPDRQALRAEVAGAERAFCCAGCRGAFELVQGEGLGDYYLRRRWDEAGPNATAALDLAAFEAAVRREGGEAELTVAIDGIRCASCVWLNERLLGRLPGVRSARVSYADHRARVRFDPAAVDVPRILARIQSAGYQPRPLTEGGQRAAQRAEVRDLLVRLGTAGFLVSQLMIYQAALYAGYFQGIEAGTRRLMEWISLGLTLPVVFYSGGPFLSATVRGLRHGRLGMDALVAVGSTAALAVSVHGMLRGGEVYFDTAAMIPALVLVGRYVEAAARGRASEAVARLSGLLPREARRVRRGKGGAPQREPVTLALLRAGDLVEVNPGERLPADGVVVEGRSEVDEALLTGEPMPVEKGPGAAVTGGTLNGLGALTVEVRRVGAETVLSAIVRAVEEAQLRKPRLQAVADRVVGVFVPALLALAALTVAGWLWAGGGAERAVLTGIAVVVIACPCALGLATPIAVAVSAGVAGGRGLLLRSGDALERAAGVTDVLLDKTGTVTRGRPALRAVVAFDCSGSALAPSAGKAHLLPDGATTEAAALALAAAAEARSEHHLGRAVREAARARADLPPLPEATAFRAVPGRGVVATVDGAEVVVGNRALLAERGIALPPAALAQAEGWEASGDTVAFLARGGALVALLALSDPLRPEAAQALSALRDLGLAPRLLSGDAARTTAAVAGALGVPFAAEASPAEKRGAVAALQARGRRVLFAGDGLNDAPALTQADVGLAVGRGVEVTLESADVVLAQGDLRAVAELLRLSRRTVTVIRQNVFWAFFYNLVAVPLAVAGLLHPIVAAAAMAASSLFVVVNSARLHGALGARTAAP
jgi:Cu2+-exporting ATPase